MKTKELAAFLFSTAFWLSTGSFAKATTPDEIALVVSWPATNSAEAVTFTIPGEYLHRSTTFLNKDGTVKSFAVLFELSGLKPLQDRSWLKEKKGTQQYEAFMKQWQGRFAMDVHQFSTGNGTGSVTEGWRRQTGAGSGYYRDGSIAGLDRYSTSVCIDHRFKSEALAKAVALKGADDPSPPGCIINRQWSILVSPVNTPNDEAAAIVCMTTGCKMFFDAVGRRASIGIDHKDIKRWSKIKKAGQSLARRFLTY